MMESSSTAVSVLSSMDYIYIVSRRQERCDQIYKYEPVEEGLMGNLEMILVVL